MPEFARFHSSRKQLLRASLFFIFLCTALTIRADENKVVGPRDQVASDVQQKLTSGSFYWREKKEVFERMRKERFVPVSVTHHAETWSFKGAGIVDAPKDFMFAETQKFEKLKEIPDHFQNVNWDASSKTLSLEIRFMSKVRALKIHIEAENNENLFFRIEQGWFQGLEGVLMVRELPDFAKNKCEVGIMAVSQERPSWVPSFIFSIAAEGVMHHVAQSLRNMAETDYKNGSEKGSK